MVFLMIVVIFQYGSVFTLAVGRCEHLLHLLFWINYELIHYSKGRFVAHIYYNVACWT